MPQTFLQQGGSQDKRPQTSQRLIKQKTLIRKNAFPCITITYTKILILGALHMDDKFNVMIFKLGKARSLLVAETFSFHNDTHGEL